MSNSEAEYQLTWRTDGELLGDDDHLQAAPAPAGDDAPVKVKTIRATREYAAGLVIAAAIFGVGEQDWHSSIRVTSGGRLLPTDEYYQTFLLVDQKPSHTDDHGDGLDDDVSPDLFDDDLSTDDELFDGADPKSPPETKCHGDTKSPETKSQGETQAERPEAESRGRENDQAALQSPENSLRAVVGITAMPDANLQALLQALEGTETSSELGVRRLIAEYAVEYFVTSLENCQSPGWIHSFRSCTRDLIQGVRDGIRMVDADQHNVDTLTDGTDPIDGIIRIEFGGQRVVPQTLFPDWVTSIGRPI